MALELTVNSVDEFQEMVDSKDFKISESIVNSILSNLNSKKNHIHILSINVLEEGSTLDLTLERKFFIESYFIINFFIFIIIFFKIIFKCVLKLDF